MNYNTLQLNIFVVIARWYFKLIGKNPATMEMVKYWKTNSAVRAKVTRAKDGSTIMQMEGEKYPFPGFPREHVLFGALAPLKHLIKNEIFNESWRKIEQGSSKEEIVSDIRRDLALILSTIKTGKPKDARSREMQPLTHEIPLASSMVPAVREIYRAWSLVAPESYLLRDALCLILNEDDSYRFRVQWLCEWFGWFFKRNPVKSFEYALKMIEHGEVVSDMKDRIRLLRRVLMVVLSDPHFKERFIALFREIDLKKLRLSKGDKYFFRGKYFKVDYKYLEY